jgi:hypothetical protein
MPHTPVLGNLSPLIPAGSDVDTTLAFYVQQLGFTTRYTQGEPTEMAIIQRDAVEIFLCRNADRYVAEQTSFRIHVQHVEQLYTEYQATLLGNPSRTRLFRGLFSLIHYIKYFCSIKCPKGTADQGECRRSWP